MNRNDLTQEMLKSVLVYDTETGIFQWCWDKSFSHGKAKNREIAGTIKSDGYVYIGLYGHRYFAHRLAWLYIYGKFPCGFLDHKNRNKSDNRINNLRECSNKQNLENQHNPQRNNTSGYRGVSYNKKDKKWTAQIKQNGTQLKIGCYFNTPEEAYIAYLKKKREIHLFYEIAEEQIQLNGG